VLGRFGSAAYAVRPGNEHYTKKWKDKEMSYTTILHVFPGEKIECGEELKNAWGSAPYVWDWLIKKYIDAESNMMYEKSAKQLWPLWKNESIPLHQRAVLLMTFDRAYVSKENYQRAADDIRAFLQDFNNTEVVNHWPRIAEIFESNPDVPAIGFWHTSVSENPFNGGWDEQNEGYFPPDWEHDCFEVYGALSTL
jgi:hypothetical protein